MRLLFRGSDKGWSNFTRYCEGSSPTIVLMKSEIDNIIFGIFSNIPWHARGLYENDNYLNEIQ